jgi:formate hydrogenlyase subunit 3/multisubunit Na+/H+ antiporter MnhD subunit
MADLGKLLILFGLLFVAAGVLFLAAGRLPWIGRLPGDILIRRDHFTFYFPLTTCLVVSAVFTLVWYLFRR